mgnify:FL=1
MLDERRKSILSVIDEYGEISLTELSALFPDVSSMTIRRDLSELESRGSIIRTKGGALSVRRFQSSHSSRGEENEYSLRARENILQKKAIAKKALPYVQKGRSIYFDAGSTIMALAELVPNENMTIITNGINVAQALVSNSNINVMVPAGSVYRNTLSVSGSDSLSFIDKINIELAFMSASAFSPESGFTVSNVSEAELKRKVISRAKKTIMLLDQSKIGKDLLFTLADISEIHVLITDGPLSAELQRLADQSGITVIS